MSFAVSGVLKSNRQHCVCVFTALSLERSIKFYELFTLLVYVTVSFFSLFFSILILDEWSPSLLQSVFVFEEYCGKEKSSFSTTLNVR